MSNGGKAKAGHVFVMASFGAEETDIGFNDLKFGRWRREQWNDEATKVRRVIGFYR